jgi:hypothetical protein
VLLIVFFAGCAASRLIVAPARAGASPQRREYACKTADGDEDVARIANAMGKEGTITSSCW